MRHQIMRDGLHSLVRQIVESRHASNTGANQSRQVRLLVLLADLRQRWEIGRRAPQVVAMAVGAIPQIETPAA